MTGEGLRGAIRALQTSHPALSVSAHGHAKHAERYVSTNGAPIGFEPARARFQNLWVRVDSIRLTRLSGIAFHACDHASFGESKPNHDLYGEPAFKNANLICFKATDIWQAVRVIAEVAGLAGQT